MKQIQLPLEATVELAAQQKAAQVERSRGLRTVEQAAALPLWSGLTVLLPLINHSSQAVRRAAVDQVSQTVPSSSAAVPPLPRALALDINKAIDQAYPCLPRAVQEKLAIATYKVL